ncbi:sugar ABC transporter substrate-binding protein [Isoptericola chiayiensis]|uniref:Sugar ABC transporter substrate-binding protein n=1 Tax=Isoptericola chiayiensis TaxID=579446 RepID=A0ABP8YRU0_9MICO|nr:sugar-binding protein [Isoptericola chiayiensis]
MRRVAATAAVLASAGVLTLSGCGALGGEDTIGVAMPTETSERWIADGAALSDGLQEAGYEVDLRYAGDEGGGYRQADQVQEMIDDGVELLIVAAVDGAGLGEQLAAAAEAGIPVIAYDRLLLESEHVDHYVTFDNYAVGVAQATALLQGLGVVDEQGELTGDTGPYDVELFAGSPDDNNTFIFWQGAMDTLQPYLDDGTLRVPSSLTDVGAASTQQWLAENARERMAVLLQSHYDDGSELDGVLSPYDGMSRGIIEALQLWGLGPSLADGLPVVTGQDAEADSVALIRDGVQQSTVFKDTRVLADSAVDAALAYLEGGQPEVDDTTTYDNGAKVVPTLTIDVEVVLRDDIDEVLVDSGYLTAAEIAAD